MNTTHIPYRILHACDSVKALEEPATKAPRPIDAVPTAKAIRAALVAGVALILAPINRRTHCGRQATPHPYKP